MSRRFSLTIFRVLVCGGISSGLLLRTLGRVCPSNEAFSQADIVAEPPCELFNHRIQPLHLNVT